MTPPKQTGLCDSCSGSLYQRIDDTEEVLKKRLDVYRNQTEPLAQYYRSKPDVLHQINANQMKAGGFNDILKSLYQEELINN